MAVQLSDLETIIRAILEDFAQTQIDIFPFSGASTIFTLTEPNSIAISTVSVNDVSSGVTFDFDISTNKINITSSLTNGDSIEIQYTHFPNFASEVIDKYVESALVHISVNRYKDFILASGGIFPEPNIDEKYLIAMVASVLLRPENVSYRLPDITVTCPKDMPTIRKVGKIISIFKSAKKGVFNIS